MALRAAIASGNWSDPATWNGGVLPTVGDVVASNTYTVTIDQNINVDSLTNAAQSIIYSNPYMTSNTAPSGIVTASNIPAPSTNDAWRAFDTSSSTWWSGGSLATPQWIAYEYPSAVAVDQYFIQGVNNGNEQGPKDFQFQGWDGTNWITLHTVTGNSSNSYTSPLIGNSTPYIKYRLYVTLGIGTNLGIVNFFFYEYGAISAATAGGGFILNDGVTVTLTGTNSITQGAVTVLTVPVATGNTTTLIGNNFVRANVSNQPLIVLSGGGTFNVSGTITGVSANSPGITITGVNSTLNYIGDINTGSGGASHGINTDVVCTINLVGTVRGGNVSNGAIGLRFNSAGIFTLVGTASGGNYSINYGVYLNNTTATITGDLYGGNLSGGNSPGVQADSNASVTVTGTMYGRVSPALISTANIYLNHYGSIISTGIHGGGGSQSNVALSSTGGGAINILTGPFISSPTGIQPLYVSRMHYRRTIGSYYEFRDNSTNGALPPAGAAPATRLVSPDTVVDAPIPANVRQGVVYASGSQTGTMIVPSRSNVANNVPVDNTLGTAVLDPNAIWAVPLTSINTLNSIGRRVKNAATVESTGAQIQQTLNNNE